MADYNPKLDRQHRNQSTSFSFKDVDNPISKEIKDPEDVHQTFANLKLIPYAIFDSKSSASGLLHFFDSLKFISPTQGACHSSIKTYTVGGGFELTKIQDEDFPMDDDGDDEIEDKESFKDFLKSVDRSSKSYTKIACDLYDEMKSNGNYWIEIIHTETDGVKASKIVTHKTESVCFYATPIGDPKVAALSLKWDASYIQRNPPRKVPLYPFYKREGTTYSTMIHIMNGNLEWYGRPDWAAAYMPAYRQHQDSDYLCKVSNNNFTGQIFIELEDDEQLEHDHDNDVENGFNGVASRMEESFSTRSDDPQTIMVSTRPYNSRPAYIHEFKINTNEGYFKASREMSRQDIIENNQWSERLLGNSVSEGFAKDAFINELRVKEIAVLNPLRDVICKGLNRAISEIIKWHERTEFEGYGIRFKSMLEQLSEEDNSEDIDTVKQTMDAFGVGVRAGALTPVIEDEIRFREQLNLEEINDDVRSSWAEDDGFRRPITLKGSVDSETTQNLSE